MLPFSFRFWKLSALRNVFLIFNFEEKVKGKKLAKSAPNPFLVEDHKTKKTKSVKPKTLVKQYLLHSFQFRKLPIEPIVLYITRKL